MGYKCTNKDGLNWYNKSTDWDKVGETLIHPNPDYKNKSACGEGYHVAHTVPDALKYRQGVPWRMFKVQGIGRPIGRDDNKGRYKKVKIISEISLTEQMRLSDVKNPEVIAKLIEENYQLEWWHHEISDVEIKKLINEHLNILSKISGKKLQEVKTLTPLVVFLNKYESWASVRDSVWASVRGSVRGSVWASVWDSVRDSVRGSVWASVRGSVWASVWDSVRGSVWASVRGSVWDSVWASEENSFMPIRELFKNGILLLGVTDKGEAVIFRCPEEVK